MMRGNRFAVGNYKQCINFDTELPSKYGQLEGQYCRAIMEIDENIQIPVLSSADMKSYLKSGICIPKSCEAKVLEENLPFMIRDCKIKGTYSMDTLDYITM